MASPEGDYLRNIRFEGNKMVGVIGFEPTTPASRTRCSTRLSHTPTISKLKAEAVFFRGVAVYPAYFGRAIGKNGRLKKTHR